MAKMDITISRDMTINTGNYSSIKPSILLTLKDVNEQDIDNEYNRLSDLADALIALEIVKAGEEMVTISDAGFKSYLKTITNMESRLQDEIRQFMRKGIINETIY